MLSKQSLMRLEVKVIILLVTFLVATFTSVTLVQSHECPEEEEQEQNLEQVASLQFVGRALAHGDCPEPEDDPPGLCERPPQNYNEVGGHWDRNLNHFCYAGTTEDGTRIVWDVLGSGCTWGEFQEHLASLGISTDYETSVPQLIAAGYWSTSGGPGDVPFPQPACYSA